LPEWNSTAYQLRDLERRVAEIEAVKPDVLAHVVGQLQREVAAMRRVLIGFAFTIAGSAIVFAFAVSEIVRS
jgi:hypothetical protein